MVSKKVGLILWIVLIVVLVGLLVLGFFMRGNVVDEDVNEDSLGEAVPVTLIAALVEEAPVVVDEPIEEVVVAEELVI